MARCRVSALAALVLMSAAWAAPGAAAIAPPAGIAAGDATRLAQYYYGTRPRERICWNERVRRFVGHDRYGRALYQSYTRRVCRYR